MKLRLAIYVSVAASGVACAATAQAQGVYYGRPQVYAAPPMMDSAIVPPGEILRIVRTAGLTPLTQPARIGPRRYAVLASDRMGGQLRVVLSAHDGRILNVRPAHDPRFAYAPNRPPAMVPVPQDAPQYRVPPSQRSGAVPPLDARSAPPAPIPLAREQRQASAPSASESSPPKAKRTPLPRPRPTTAPHDRTASAPAAAPVAAPPPTAAAQSRQSPAAPAPKTAQTRPSTPATPTPLVPVAPLE